MWGENRFLYRWIKYNIFGLIPKTSYVTQTLNIKYRDTIEHHDISSCCCCIFCKISNLSSLLALVVFNISAKVSLLLISPFLDSPCQINVSRTYFWLNYFQVIVYNILTAIFDQKWSWFMQWWFYSWSSISYLYRRKPFIRSLHEDGQWNKETTPIVSTCNINDLRHYYQKLLIKKLLK